MMRRRSFVSSAVLMALTSNSICHAALQKGGERYIGLSLPMSGAQAGVGGDLEKGYQLAMKASGNPYKLLILDDGGKSEQTVANVRTLASNPNVIVLSGIVGTPHAQAALPVAIERGLPVVAIRSGADFLRDGRKGVYHLRSSYNEELDTIAKMCLGSGLKSISILYSDDIFGEGSKAYLQEKLGMLRLTVLPPIQVDREGGNIAAVSAKCAAQVTATEGVGIVFLLISQTMTQAAMAVRTKHNIKVPMIAMSVTATKSVTSMPVSYLDGLGLVSAFPIPTSSSSRIARQFGLDAEEFKVPQLKGSMASIEGYFYGCVIAKTGATSRSQIVEKMNAGVMVIDQLIKPDSKNVCFKHLQVVMKTSAGRLIS